MSNQEAEKIFERKLMAKLALKLHLMPNGIVKYTRANRMCTLLKIGKN